MTRSMCKDSKLLLPGGFLSWPARDQRLYTMRARRLSKARPDPRITLPTTPRPLPLIKALVKDPTVRVTRGSTFDNAANLADSALAVLRAKYEGTRLGRQELAGEIVDALEGALWQPQMLEP